jgi:protein tyrosine phosphatase
MMIENQDILACSAGAKPSNRLKNRYKDVLPCKSRINTGLWMERGGSVLDDKYRVILQLENDSDYINASYIEVISFFLCILIVFLNEGFIWTSSIYCSSRAN